MQDNLIITQTDGKICSRVLHERIFQWLSKWGLLNWILNRAGFVTLILWSSLNRSGLSSRSFSSQKKKKVADGKYWTRGNLLMWDALTMDMELCGGIGWQNRGYICHVYFSSNHWCVLPDEQSLYSRTDSLNSVDLNEFKFLITKLLVVCLLYQYRNCRP